MNLYNIHERKHQNVISPWRLLLCSLMIGVNISSTSSFMYPKNNISIYSSFIHQRYIMRSIEFYDRISFNFKTVSKLSSRTTIPNSSTGQLTTYKEEKLDSSSVDELLTFEQQVFFDSLDKNIYGVTFIDRLKDLQVYKNYHGGSCLVPKRYPNNPTLGNWVNKTRQMYRRYRAGEKSSMSPERIDILNNMDFIWSASTTQMSINSGDDDDDITLDNDSEYSNHNNDKFWNVRYAQLKQYYQNDCEEPHNQMSSTTSLGAWATRQRREYQNFKMGQKSSLNSQRVSLLNSINFDWDPKETKWKQRVNELIAFKKKYGHCIVPVDYSENPSLGRWVATQRKYYKSYKAGKLTYITKDRIQQLSKVGFVWNRWDYLPDGKLI